MYVGPNVTDTKANREIAITPGRNRCFWNNYIMS